MSLGSIERRLWLCAGVGVVPVLVTWGLAAIVGATGVASLIAVVLASLGGLALATILISRLIMRPLWISTRYLMSSGSGENVPSLPRYWETLSRDLEGGRARRHLIAETSRLQKTVFDASPNAVVISDQSGFIISVNPAADRLFGVTDKAASRARMSDLIAPASLPESALGPLDGNILDHLGQKLVLDGRHVDGHLFPAEISIYRVGTGRETLYAAYVRDLTAQQEARAVQQAQQERVHQSEKHSALGSLLAGVAHELNNPLAILMTQATLLREKAPTPDVARRADRIHAASQRAGRIVKSFLSMAKQKSPILGPVQVNDIVQSALEMVGYGLRSAGISVETQLDPALPLVEADRDLIGQVLANLLINAQQALSEKAGERRITVVTSLEDGAVVIEVADNGAGIPSEIRDRIFEPYFTTKPAGAGTGIGLSICTSVVAAHAGRFEAVTDRAEGATFRVTLPCATPTSISVPPVGDLGGGLSILVVDDETDVAEALAELLDIFGHRTVVLSSAMDALDQIRRVRFDVIFTDLRMPGMNGLSLRQAIESVDERLAQRTVIMTGDTMGAPGSARGAGHQSEGMILEKPFTAEDVRGVLARLVDA